jgi:hypothetical protein
MTWVKFGQERHKPPGEWAQTTIVQKVAGVAHHRVSASRFASAVKNAEVYALPYGLRLEPEPTNKFDPNAIRVIGFADTKGWMGGTKRQEWLIGYVSANTAAELKTDLISHGVPIAAELYNIFQDGGFLDFNFIVLAPPGYGHGARLKTHPVDSNSATGKRNKVAQLRAAGNLEGAIKVLLDACEAEESNTEHGLAPWCYDDLAKLFRQMRLPKEEITILERYSTFPVARGRTGERLLKRLESLRKKTV